MGKSRKTPFARASFNQPFWDIWELFRTQIWGVHLMAEENGRRGRGRKMVMIEGRICPFHFKWMQSRRGRVKSEDQVVLGLDRSTTSTRHLSEMLLLSQRRARSQYFGGPAIGTGWSAVWPPPVSVDDGPGSSEGLIWHEELSGVHWWGPSSSPRSPNPCRPWGKEKRPVVYLTSDHETGDLANRWND